MTDLIVVPQAAHWQRLKRLVLDSVSSPITRRVYNLGPALPKRPSPPGALHWRPAGLAPFPSTCGSRRSASCPGKQVSKGHNRSACAAQVRARRICCLRRDEEALCLRCEPSSRLAFASFPTSQRALVEPHALSRLLLRKAQRPHRLCDRLSSGGPAGETAEWMAVTRVRSASQFGAGADSSTPNPGPHRLCDRWSSGGPAGETAEWMAVTRARSASQFGAGADSSTPNPGKP